jgi:hypothetical protein
MSKFNCLLLLLAATFSGAVAGPLDHDALTARAPLDERAFESMSVASINLPTMSSIPPDAYVTAMVCVS